MDRVGTWAAGRGLRCPRCGRGHAQGAGDCALGATAPRPPPQEADGLRPPPEVRVESPDPRVVLGLGALLAPVFALTPLLQYMGWFLSSLVHEIGHCAAAWLCGQPAYPAIRLDGHAAALHKEQQIVLVVLVGAGLAWLVYASRRRRALAIGLGSFLALYPLLALTDAKEVIHLLAGHVGELAFATVFFQRALSGGFTESTAERIGYATVACYLLGRNLLLDLGLMTSASARATYAGNGSFGLTNDFIRAARELGWSLEGVATLMLLVALCSLPVAAWLWRRLDDPRA